jgi:hypothetical protein
VSEEGAKQRQGVNREYSTQKKKIGFWEELKGKERHQPTKNTIDTKFVFEVPLCGARIQVPYIHTRHDPKQKSPPPTLLFYSLVFETAAKFHTPLFILSILQELLHTILLNKWQKDDFFFAHKFSNINNL